MKQKKSVTTDLVIEMPQVLIAIPYYEWDEVQFDNVKEEEYVKSTVDKKKE